MRRVSLLALPLVVVALVWTAAGAGAGIDQTVASAALAPYLALVQRDAAGVCAAFTSPVAARLVVGARAGSSCTADVMAVFRAVPTDRSSTTRVGSHLTVSQTTGSATRATAVVRYGDVGIATLALQRVDGAWKIATGARLGLLDACVVGDVPPIPDMPSVPSGDSPCAPDQRWMQLAVGGLTPVSGRLANEGSTLPIPAPVVKAGGAELSDFLAGRHTFEVVGCQACHALAGQGNTGPGPALDRVGARLSRSRLMRALDDPTAPMPSYRNLPRSQYGGLIAFLADQD
jgi:mono/diheme cytochrome c family protein